MLRGGFYPLLSLAKIHHMNGSGFKRKPSRLSIKVGTLDQIRYTSGRLMWTDEARTDRSHTAAQKLLSNLGTLHVVAGRDSPISNS